MTCFKGAKDMQNFSDPETVDSTTVTLSRQAQVCVA